jgi:uncharacterized membrane protein YkoI
MTRRAMLQALTISVLVAALSCSLSPASALAQSGNGHSKSQEDKPRRGQAENQRQTKDQRQATRYKEQTEKDKRQAQKDKYQAPKDQRQAPRDKQGYSEKAQKRLSLSPQQAAQRARAQYGGQVLKVGPAGSGYQVRLLKDDGRVMTVNIGD